MHKRKRDKYLGERGGSAKFITILCAKCSNYLLLYQKDGIGILKRCYLNRILEPKEMEELQRIIKDKKNLKNLICNKCKNIIGIPMTYKDGRLAFRLIPGSFLRKNFNLS